MRIITWNIAGGHPINSFGRFDYGVENLEYFITEIRKCNPDVVCLQEVHTPREGGVSQAAQIAKALDLPYVVNAPANVSHIDTNFNIGVAVLSRLPILSEKTILLPNPNLESEWSDGTLAYTHEKNLQIITFADFTLINTHMLPIKLFGYTYDDTTRGGQLAQEINTVMQQVVPAGPLIWCGDFNFNDPFQIFPYMRTLQLSDTLPDEGTKPVKGGTKKCPDHIYCTDEFTVQQSRIEKTDTDHYLCITEFAKR